MTQSACAAQLSSRQFCSILFTAVSFSVGKGFQWVFIALHAESAMQEDGSNCDGMKAVVHCANKLGCPKLRCK